MPRSVVDQLRSADVVVVGGGTVARWTAVLLAEAALPNVVLIEARTLGDGATVAPRAWCGPRAAPKPPSGWAYAPRSFYAASGDRFLPA